MEINITLVIQGVNFILAFLFLKYVLLIPLFNFLEERKNIKSAKLHCILNLEESVAQQIGYKRDRWRSFQKKFLEGIPVILDSENKKELSVNSSFAKPTKDEDVQTLVSEVEGFIVKRVLNGNL